MIGPAPGALSCASPPNAIVTIDYILTDDAGEVLDSSRDTEPLSYLHGLGAIIPGLEAALEGRVAGDSFQIAIAPELAYGHRDDSLQQVVARTMLNAHTRASCVEQPARVLFWWPPPSPRHATEKADGQAARRHGLL